MDQQSALFEPQPGRSVAIMPLLRRQLWLSLVIVLGSLALGAVVSLLWPRTYTATATLAYDPQIPLTRGGGGLAMTDPQRDAAIDAQLAQITTIAVAQTVAGSLDQAANPQLAKEADKVAASSERRLSRNEALGTALLAHVKAQRLGQTPDFTIAFTGRNAAQAALIANGFATSYLASAVRQKAALADGSARQLATSVTRLREAATAADDRLATFRLAHHLLNPPDSPALEQEVAVLRGQLADAHGQAALAGIRSAMAGRSVVGGGAGGSVDTSVVSALTQQRATAAAELAALLSRYGEKHPDVIAARQKQSEVDTQLAEAMRGNGMSAVIEARAAGARAQALAGSLGNAEAQLAGNVGHDAQLLDLQNSALAARLAYQDALKISADQTAQRALIQPDAQVIAFAYPPLRAQSRLADILFGGLGLGLSGAATAAAWRERRRRTLGSADDIVRWLNTDFFAPLPLLATGLPVTRSADPIAAALQQPQSAFAAGIHSLATTALFAARQRETSGGRVIGVTSAMRGEGKTTTSIAMGRVLAAAGMKVTLIDGDPHGGVGMGALAGLPGLGDDAGVADRGFDTKLPGAAGGELARMVATLRHDYDVVIVDTAPILPGGDSRHLLACLDALVLLVRWRATPVPAIRTAIRRITAAGGHISGAALTMVGGTAIGSITPAAAVS